ncbi:Integral membrane protein [Edwardsiella anguillarum]|uniref:DUF4396 domain-containing protein n=1 Tax=Edwardsiella TaxID=635 RepID=UPI00045D2BDF|nr:DUF4396 domain-containing protein [Edwardsiella anguillarum]AKM48176.1 membrane protein [Edwardsiella sp. EA181011]GAJ66608.1 integral membrane protein [Edwardsiella piscicida]RFT04005.1 DUF4396 domain-containing protein [Edwardsiella anguillarum]BET80538.1 Integral membrane protein [Edwardsiella anguillarum]BET83827.1 Integral membrane protein [Edwardsiella anguillarum]
MSYPEWLHLLAWSWLISALICAVIIVWDIRRGHPQPMAIMTVAWPINALYFGVLGLGAYFWFGRGHPGDRCGMMAMDMPAAGHGATPMAMDMPAAGHGETPMAMDMPAAGHGATPMAMDMPAAGHGAAPMAMDMPAAGHGATPMAMDMTAAGHGATPMAMDMPMAGHGDMPMAMKRGPAGWKSIFKTSTHCGTGCTLADILGEGIALVVPVTLLGSSLLGSWTLDFVLALCLGIFFQYWPARQMGQPRWVALKSAIKADVLSLICWQLGMYVWMAIALFLLFTPEMPRASALYWFMMQIAMIVGFCSAYPMNRWLVSKGIKHAM